jgi:CheY-like chemotaxis protein
LRLDAELADIPVVMVTISSDRRHAFSLGAIEHLVKPIASKDLLETLTRRNLGGRREGPFHVLVVDDDARQIELVVAALGPFGFRVRGATTGARGLQAAAAGPVDLVLLDQVLPDMTGIELAAALKRAPRTAEVPILLVTANDLSDAARAQLNEDVEKVLAKGSLRPAQLVAEVTAALGRRR